MYAGRVAESGSVTQVFDRPTHPYTRGLLASIPRLESERKARLTTIDGLVPSLHEMPAGCRFQTRGPLAVDACRAEPPPLIEIEPGHHAACIRWQESGKAFAK
jgi:oligopeptide/dipeptide ABC transporter ATP-binding protein